MKKMKKLMALLLAAVMLMAMGSMTGIAAEGVTITVERDDTYESSATGTREYKWYKVFSASYSNNTSTNTDSDKTAINASADAAAYTATSTVAAKLGTWNATTKTWTKAVGNEWFDLTPIAGTTNYSVAWAGSATAKVQAAAAWLVKNGVYEDQGDLKWNEADANWKATVEKGYYVIEGSEGENLVAATTDINITEKNTYPTIEKNQKDEDVTTGVYADTKLNVAVGDVIDYEIRVDVPADANKTVAVIDKMTAGLTYDATAGLTVKDAAGDSILYRIMTSADAEYDATADWQIKFAATDVAGKTIVITFSATVNDSALTDTARDNTVTLKYNNKHYVMSDEVEYTTYFTGIEKVDGKDNDVKLEGVEFTLKEDGKDFKVTKVGEYYVPDATGSATVVTGEDGLIKIRGLDKDKTYTLTETETLDGYNMLDVDVELTLTEDTGNAFESAEADTFTDVVNNKGTVLPSTGGIGTTIFYIVGVALVLCAGVLLVTRRRMNVQK